MYTPDRDFVGTDRFHFVVFDGEVSEVAYVVIKVTDREPVNSVSRQQSIPRTERVIPRLSDTLEKSAM